MMKISPVSAWKYLASKVHPPLPINPRDSQKLLSLLNTSFREQLEQEHPEITSGERQATDAHINSILRSPLFSPLGERRYPVTSQHPNPSTDMVESVRTIAKDVDNGNVVEHFRRLVANGRADLEAAQLCLISFWNRVKILPKEVRFKEMKASQAGAVVLHWLWSSGTMHSSSFLREKRFVGALMPFVIVEGRTALVWQWLRLLRDEVKEAPVDAAMKSSIDAQGVIIKQYIQSPFHSGYDFKIQEFLKVVGEVSSWGYPYDWTSSVLRPAGAILTLFLIRDPNVSNISIKFSAFTDTALIWNRKGVYEAILQTRHPKHPDPSFALHYLKTRGSDYMDVNLSRQKKIPIMLLCLDTAQILAKIERHQEARFVMDFLEANFAAEIGSQNIKSIPLAYQSLWKERKESAKRHHREWSLRMLDRLAI